MRRCGFRHERRLRAAGFAAIAGIDEAGRGALAGPVVAAAVVLPERFRHKKLNDSKQLLPEKREEIYRDLTDNVAIVWSIGVVDSLEIDQLNILRATHKAMRIAVAALEAFPDHALIDGLPVYPFPLPQTAVIDGDCISLSIAAASVIAKVTRDMMMREFCARFPEYCFSQHKGYGTELHLTKLHAHGPCPIHRRSFEPVAQPLFGFAREVTDRDTLNRMDGMADRSEAAAPVETPSANFAHALADSDERQKCGYFERDGAESRNPVAVPFNTPAGSIEFARDDGPW